MKFNLKSHRIKAVPLNRQRFGGITLFLAFEVEKYTGACYTYNAINRLYVPGRDIANTQQTVDKFPHTGAGMN